MHERSDERGVALVLTLIFAILLYILVAELVVSGRMVRATGENDVLLARIQSQMEYQQQEVEQMLLDDLAGQAAGGGAAGGAGAGPLGGALPGAGGAGGGEEQDPAAACDSSRDSWFDPFGKPDGDLTTYIFVEDENRKLNLLALWSPDEKFAEFTRDRVVRLIDKLREDTDFDVSSSDAERIVRDLLDWVKRAPNDAMPRPKLKSDDPNRADQTIPLHLDELLMLPSVTEDLFYDKVLDGRVILGLESVLTVWTSLQLDPGDPQKVQRQRAQAAASGQNGTGEGGTGAAGQPGAAGAGGAGTGAAGAGAARANDPNAPPPQPEGQGIRINLNTASRPVLRSLWPEAKIPDAVIDAILKYRNEEEEQTPEELAAATTNAREFGDLQLGSQKKRKFFAEVGDLEQIPEFASLPDPQLKAEFQRALTTKSDVFSIHFATLYKRNEENRVYMLRRARSIVVRRDNGEEGQMYPLVLLEERHGLRLQPIDIQDQPPDPSAQYLDMDQFAQEERAWNPFLIDFYLPKHQREEFYRPRR